MKISTTGSNRTIRDYTMIWVWERAHWIRWSRPVQGTGGNGCKSDIMSDMTRKELLKMAGSGTLAAIGSMAAALSQVCHEKLWWSRDANSQCHKYGSDGHSRAGKRAAFVQIGRWENPPARQGL